MRQDFGAVNSREDFITFVKLMCKDLSNNQASWPNNNLGSFLEALGAWVEDMDGYYLNQGKPVPNKLDWNVLSDMLKAARIYE